MFYRLLIFVPMLKIRLKRCKLLREVRIMCRYRANVLYTFEPAGAKEKRQNFYST